MYKIPDQVVQFIKKTMETWRAELATGGESLAAVKIQRSIFQGDALSPLLFVIAMMTLNHILKKCTAGYKLSKSKSKEINHLMHMDDIKLFCPKRKRNGNPNTNCENIQSRYRDGIWHRKMCHASNESGKGHMTEGVELLNQVVIRTLGVKETCKYFEILEADTTKQVEMKGKI